jgi:hypothetical protein
MRFFIVAALSLVNVLAAKNSVPKNAVSVCTQAELIEALAVDGAYVLMVCDILLEPTAYPEQIEGGDELVRTFAIYYGGDYPGYCGGCSATIDGGGYELSTPGATRIDDLSHLYVHEDTALTVKNVKISGASGAMQGAIFIRPNTNTLFEGVWFFDNWGGSYGGTAFVNGKTTFRRCFFEQSFSNYMAGAVYQTGSADRDDAQVTFDTCGFVDVTSIGEPQFIKISGGRVDCEANEKTKCCTQMTDEQFEVDAHGHNSDGINQEDLEDVCYDCTACEHNGDFPLARPQKKKEGSDDDDDQGFLLIIAICIAALVVIGMSAFLIGRFTTAKQLLAGSVAGTVVHAPSDSVLVGSAVELPSSAGGRPSLVI